MSSDSLKLNLIICKSRLVIDPFLIHIVVRFRLYAHHLDTPLSRCGCLNQQPTHPQIRYSSVPMGGRDKHRVYLSESDTGERSTTLPDKSESIDFPNEHSNLYVISTYRCSTPPATSLAKRTHLCALNTAIHRNFDDGSRSLFSKARLPVIFGISFGWSRNAWTGLGDYMPLF